MALVDGAKLHILTSVPKQHWHHYLVHKLAVNWESMGFKVSTGPIAEVPADLAAVICHWDQTQVEAELVPSNPHGIPMLNHRILDISKRSFSSLILSKGEDWQGPVIVKTNMNCFGHIEQRKRQRTFLQLLQRGLSELNWKWACCLPPGEYPVLDSISEVPDWVWADSKWVVEKFLPERDGDLYCIRFWVFFGTQGYMYRLASTEPVVKNRDRAVSFEFFESEPPEALQQFRKEHQLDFGKIDYVETEAGIVPFDINKTPTLASESGAPHLKQLSKGIFDFLQR